jgi:hypothetical protein
MEDQAFSPFVQFGSSTTPLVSKLHWRHIGRLRKRDNLLTGERRRGEGGGGGANLNHTMARKSGLLYNNNFQYSLLLTPEKGNLLLKMFMLWLCKPHTITLKLDYMHA